MDPGNTLRSIRNGEDYLVFLDKVRPGIALPGVLAVSHTRITAEGGFRAVGKTAVSVEIHPPGAAVTGGIAGRSAPVA